MSTLPTHCELVLKSGKCHTLNADRTHWIEEVSDVYIDHGRIVHVGSGQKILAKQEIDCTGLAIFPGFIDSQVHMREPGLTHKDDFGAGTYAAIKGGITGVFEMPNTKPPTTTLHAFQQKIDIASQKMWTNFAFYAGATGNNSEELLKIETQPGCCGTKIFMGSSTGDLLVDEDTSVERTLSRIKGRVAVHSEDEALLKKQVGRQIVGQTHSHALWRDEQVALSCTQRLINIARKVHKQVHILHITTWQEIELLAHNKDLFSVEVTPQHLTFSAPEIYDRLGNYAQMNPPIRSKDHQLGLWRGIDNHTVTIIGSDHAPHTIEEKNKVYPQSPSGMPGVQTILPVMLNHVHEKRLSLQRLSELMCSNVVRYFGIRDRGAIATGMVADLSVIDLKRSEVIGFPWLSYKCNWSPFEGYRVTGWPVMTLVNGNVSMREGQILGMPKGQAFHFDAVR